MYFPTQPKLEFGISSKRPFFSWPFGNVFFHALVASNGPSILAIGCRMVLPSSVTGVFFQGELFPLGSSLSVEGRVLLLASSLAVEWGGVLSPEYHSR